MKDQHAASKRKAHRASPVEVGTDGMIDSNSEDERISRSNKRKAPSPMPEKSKKESVIEGSGKSSEKNVSLIEKEEKVNGKKGRDAAAAKRKRSAA